MTVREKLIATLESLGHDAFLEDSIAPDKYPENFFTFWNFQSNNESYSNNDLVTNWGFNVRFYSKSPQTVEQVKVAVLKSLKEAGFTPNGNGTDFVYSTDTRHLGWSIDVYYLEVR